MVDIDKNKPFEETISLTEDGFWFYDWESVSDRAIEKLHSMLFDRDELTELQKGLIASGAVMIIALVSKSFAEIHDELQSKLDNQVQTILEAGLD